MGSREVTLEDLLEDEINDNLIMPDFQRDFVWKIEEQKLLAATFLTNVPLTSFLFLEGTHKDFSYKRLCFRKKDNSCKATNSDRQCHFILDGQQRLSTLKNVFSNLYSGVGKKWREIYDRVDSKLRYRWFLNIRPIIDSDVDNIEGITYGDIFGYDKLSEPKKMNELEPGDLVDYIIPKQILIKDECSDKHNEICNTDKWWHPSYDHLINANKLRVANIAAQEHLIPLYLTYNLTSDGANSLIFQIINQIAKERAEQLENEISNGKRRQEDIFQGELLEAYEQNKEDAWRYITTTWATSINKMLVNLMRQTLFYIELRANEVGRAVTIFENMNRAGTKLSVFDLLVARAASVDSRNESLAETIKHLMSKKIQIPDSVCSDMKNHVNVNISSNMMLLVDSEIDSKFKDAYTSLLGVKKYITDDHKILSDDIKREKVLKLSSEEICDFTESVISALIKAYAILQYRCGIISINKLNYRMMILPIAALFLDDNNDCLWNNEIVIDRIECWYWASLFSGRYYSNQNAHSSEDVQKIYDFVIKGNTSDMINLRIENIFNLPNYSDLNALLGKGEEKTNWNEAMHQGILSYILSTNPYDFVGEAVRLTAWDAAEENTVRVDNHKFVIKLEDHHLIPLQEGKNSNGSIKSSTKALRSDKTNILNSPLNRTYISEFANGEIGGNSISSYLENVNSLGKEGHFVPRKALIQKKLIGKLEKDIRKYYEEILTERFNAIKDAMSKELRELEHPGVSI